MNKAVTEFLDDLNHPFRQEIEALRKIILGANESVEENIKWNGPNYSVGINDRVSIKVLPPKQIMVIFHRGAKVLEQPKEKLLSQDYGLLEWKANDRAIAAIRDMEQIERHRNQLSMLVKNWLDKTL
jgi:hypothetical protein